jgi:hypothetical protein
MFSGIMNRGHKIKGTVVLMRKNVLDINSLTSVGGVIGQGFDILGSTLDNLTAFLGRSVSLQLISATKPDGNFFLHFFYFILSIVRFSSVHFLPRLVSPRVGDVAPN